MPRERGRGDAEAGPSSRVPFSFGGLGLGALAATLVAALVAAWRLRDCVGLFWEQDDAYISFRYARNLLRGHGLVFNVGERVEGYTNFLWTLLSAIPMKLGQADPIGWMTWLGFGLLAASYLVLLGLGVALARRGLAFAPLMLAPLLFLWSFNLWFLSGMETGLVAFLAIAGAALVAFEPRGRAWAPAAASTAGILAMLARADAAPIWIGLAVTGLGFAWARERRLTPALRREAVAWLAPAALLYLPYTVWRVAYYGSLYPNTYYAKAIYLPAWSRGAEYLGTFFSVYPVAPLLIAAPLGAWLARVAIARRFLTAATLIGALTFVYVLRVGGDFMEWRFLVPALGVLVPAIVLGLGVIAGAFAGGAPRAARSPERGSRPGPGPARRPAPSRAAAWAPNLVGGLAAVGLTAFLGSRLPAATSIRMEGQEVIGELARYCDERQFAWRAVAHRLDQIVPRDVRVATTAAGLIPFTSDRPVLDMHGLTDREIAHIPVEPGSRGRMGHEHFVRDPETLRRRGAGAILVWGQPSERPESDTYRPPGDLVLACARIPDGRWFSIVVLDTNRVALARLRRDPGVTVTMGEAIGRAP
jgi:arabinofuranosyltransferase